MRFLSWLCALKNLETGVTHEIAQISGIAITVDGEPVENLTSTTIKFVNKGSQTIDEADFRKTAPLALSITDGHFIGDQYKTAISSKSPNLEPEIFPIGSDMLQIAFDCIKPKEFFSVTLLHDGVLSVYGDLKEGAVKEHSEIPLSLLSGFVGIFSSLFSSIVALLAGFRETHEIRHHPTRKRKAESKNETGEDTQG